MTQPSTAWASLAPIGQQLVEFRSVQQLARLSDRQLDAHCRRTFGCAFAELNRGEMCRVFGHVALLLSGPDDWIRVWPADVLAT